MTKTTPAAKKKKILVRLLLLLGLLSLSAAAAGYYWLTAPAAAPADKSILFTVSKGSGLKQIALGLKQAGLIKHELALILASRLQGTAASLKAGEYSLTPGMSAWELAQILHSGRANLYPVALPEGFTMAQIIERLSQPPAPANELRPLDKDSALALVYDPQFIASLGIKADSLEGYLFPDTYYFGVEDNQRTRETLERLVSQFEKTWNSQISRGPQRLSRHQLVTLASIIEKETGVERERPLVSAVYHNRLKTGMPLQADPTVIYRQEGPITRRHLETDHPYNTYTRPGLPPGPICSPGLASLQAACAPAQVDYLYFVATGEADGSHNFARTLEEHQRNVRQYRQRSR